MKILFLLLLTYGAVGQKKALPVIHSIDEAQERSALFSAPNGKTYRVDFWNDPDDILKGRGIPVINCSDNHFTGIDRKAAKTSNVNQGTYKTFEKITDIFTQDRLPTDALMQHKVTRNSSRIAIEQNGVILDHLYLYAFKRGSDNDYHLIIGDPKV